MKQTTKEIKKVILDYDSELSLIQADQQHIKLQNAGFSVIKTEQIGVNKFCLTYEGGF